MTKEEILKLISAGYTKADIDAMETAEAKPEPEKKPEPEAKPEPEEKPENKNEEITGEMLKEFTGAINGLSDLIKKSNIVVDGYQPKTAMEKGEEVLASLINPPAKETK